MKPLTIEELKALQVGDWVWIVTPTNTGEYYQKFYESNDGSFVGASLHYGFDEPYKGYGTKWLAYKNKEMAEGVEDSEIIKFYYDPNNKDRKLSEYVFCFRPCDDNMSLKAFMPNGEICGYASEGYDTWVEGAKQIKEISCFEFMYNYVRPMLKQIHELKGE